MGNHTRLSIAVLICLALTAAVFADGKIPVTTSSPEARELYSQARHLFEIFKFADARALYEQAVAKDPGFALAYRDLAQVQPSFKGFQENMTKAVSFADKVSECERFWILADDAGGKFDVAKQRDYLGKLIAGCPDDERGHTAFGVYYFARQYFDSSAAELQKAVVLGPKHVPAWNMLGYARRNLNDFPGAEEAFRKYIELSPDDANAYDSYAELLLKEGKYEESVTQYRKALAVDTTFILSHFNMAAPLIYLGKHDEARHELGQLLHRAGDDGQRQTAYFGTMVSYADECRLDNAIQTMMTSNALSEKINDNAAMSQNNATIGFLKLEQGKYDDALTYYGRALELAHTVSAGENFLALAERNMDYVQARIAAVQGDAAKAADFAAAFAVKAKANGSVDALRAMHELNGIVALEAKEYQKAIDELAQGPANNGYDIYRMAMAYHGLGDKANALAKMTAAAHMNSVPNLNDVLQRENALRLVEEWSKK